MSSKKQRNIRKPQQFEDSKVEGYFMVSKRDALVAVANKLTGSQCRLWIYLMAINSFADYTESGEIKYHDLPSIPDIAVAVGCSPDTVEKDLRKLDAVGLLPKWLILRKSKADTERQIQDRLKAELGDQVEVITAVGRIDLLTESEVIEIKDISDWKEALGKILAYSAFFPEHSKRIHLFGRADLSKLALAQSTCSEFGITVTFEEVQ